MNFRSISILAVTTLLLIGCNGGTDDSAAGNSGASAGEATWLLTSMPADAQSVADAKKTAKEGETVALRGRIGGQLYPFTKGAAVFIVMDSNVPSCADKGDKDHCPTPWDYCCETPASKLANSATIQLVDDGGQPLIIDLEAFGLKPLDEVIVVGRVGARPSDDVLMIHATGLHRVKS